MRRTKPIPENAKMVFKGKIFEVWQWEQKLFDGTTATFERLKRPNTAKVIPVAGDKILIVDQQQPDTKHFTTVPGGRCDEGEDPLVAAKRELLEETGYMSDDWTLFREENPVGKIEWTIYTYVARNCKKVQEPALDAGEQMTSRLITFDEFIQLGSSADFYDKELDLELSRAQFDAAKKEELRALLFKN